MTDTGSSAGGESTTDATAVSVLYVDPDRSALAAVERFVDSERTDIGVETATDVGTALDRLDGRVPDCLVVSAGVRGEDWNRLVDATTAPVVLYAAPGTATDAHRADAATIVEKGNGEGSRRFLAEKLVSVASANAGNEQREMLELLVERAQDGLYRLDEEGVVEFCNESFAEMLGYDRETLVGSHASVVQPDEELQRGQRLIEELLRSDDDSATIDLTLLDSDGNSIETSVTVTLLTENGSYAGLVGVVRDVTDRRARERRLEQYETLVESAGDPMFVLDGDGRVELCNEAFADLFDRRKPTLPGTPLSALLSRADATRIRETAAHLDPDEWVSCDLRVGDPGEGERLFEVTVGTLRGETAGTVATLHDVTARERREEELDLLKQVLTRVLRHDVRSGLTVIRGQAEVIRERADGETAGFAQTIIDRSESLVQTTEKARAIEGVLESDDGRTTVDLRSVVNRAVANVAAAHPEAEYDVQLTSRTPVVVHHALPYAIEDLVENAVVHNDSDRPQVTITVDGHSEWVRLRVTDNGPGIPDEELEVIERGEETPLKHGTGVGLWLVNWVLDRSGGDLSFENGGSTTATLRLERAATDEMDRDETGKAEPDPTDPDRS